VLSDLNTPISKKERQRSASDTASACSTKHFTDVGSTAFASSDGDNNGNNRNNGKGGDDNSPSTLTLAMGDQSGHESSHRRHHRGCLREVVVVGVGRLEVDRNLNRNLFLMMMT